MSGYGKLFDAYWDGEKIEPLSDQACLLGTWLISGKHRNAIGCFRIGVGAITDVHRFKKWGIEGVEKALREMMTTGFIVRDEATGWTFITNHLTKDPIKGDKTAKHAARLALDVPIKSPVYAPLYAKLEPQLRVECTKHGITEAQGWPMRTPSEGASQGALGGTEIAPAQGAAQPHAMGPPSPAPEPAPEPPLPSVAARAGEGGDRPARVTKPGGSRKRCPLPPDWTPSENQTAYARELGLIGEPLQVTVGQFRWYWTEGAGKGTARDAKGWDRTWFTWAAKDARRIASGGNRGNRPDPAEQERQDRAAVYRGMGFGDGGEPERVDVGGAGGADTRGDPGDNRSPDTSEREADDGRDRQAGVVVPDVRDQHAQHRADIHPGSEGGPAAPATGPADAGIRDDQEHAQMGHATTLPEGDSRHGERRVSAPTEDQGGPVPGEPGTGGQRAAGDTGAAGRGNQGGGPGAVPLAHEPGQLGPEGEDLLDIPAFLRRTDTSVQVH